MNKVYKLIQTYPGSPALGTQVIEREKDYHSPLLGIVFPHKSIIEDYPQNWDLEQPLHFTISSIESPNGTIYTDKASLLAFCYNAYPDYKIKSIKRLSDGEVFSLGDTITGTFYGLPIDICEFKISKNVLRIFSKESVLTLTSNGAGINLLKKYLKPLFKTEDKVSIFEGNTYWCVNTAPHLWSLFEQTSKENTKLSKGVLAFSTKQEAEKYITMNKSEFSRAQIIDFLVKLGYEANIINQIQ